MDIETLKNELNRCIGCKPRPCEKACPLGVSPHDFIAVAKNEGYQESAKLIAKKNPLPQTCGLVCPDCFCQKACIRGRMDSPIKIPCLQAKMIQLGGLPKLELPEPNGKKVAVIGGGPAGIGATYELISNGYNVTIYEKENKLGGVARLIPEYRLPKSVLDEEIARITQNDRVTVKLNTEITDFSSLKQEYDDVILALGEPLEYKLNVPGDEACISYKDVLKTEREDITSPVILEARRQSLHIGDPQTDAKHSESNAPALARPHLKQKTEDITSPVILEAQNETSNRSSSRRDVSHSTSGIHKQNIEDVATSYDGDLAHPKFKTERDSVATGGINCHAMSDATSDVYKKGYTSECRRSYDGDLARPLLILANDSTIPLADSFTTLLADMQQKEADIYGITANQDGTYHIQSYFMILNEKAYTNPNFANYLNNVKKEQDGLTVAYRYEVPFTQYMQNLGYKTATYIPYESLQHLPLNDKNCYPLTLISKYNMPVLKMRTFTNRLTVQEPRRLVFSWLKKHKPQAYKELIKHLTKIKSSYLSENK